jgi:SMI1 / KNR4 family (SUKH-1)
MIYPYQDLMKKWNDELLSSELCNDKEWLTKWLISLGYSGEVKWLGREGATEAAIQQAEERLKLRLPPSYRQFLVVSNGWSMLNNFVGGLRRVEEVDLFSNTEPKFYQFVKEFEKSLQEEDRRKIGHGVTDKLLQIGDPVVDAVTVYMSSEQKKGNEFVVWEFIPWAAEWVEHDSFWDFLQATYKKFKEFNSG